MQKPLNRPAKVGDICMMVFPSDNYGKRCVMVALSSEYWLKGAVVQTLESTNAIKLWGGSRYKIPAGTELQCRLSHLVPLGDEGQDADDAPAERERELIYI